MSWSIVALLLAGAWLGYWVGWINAHHTVADECRKLGAFYVGKRVFKCTEIETKQ